MLRVKKQFADARRSVIVKGWEKTPEAPLTAEAAVPATDSWVILLRGGELSRMEGTKPSPAFGKNPPRFILRAGTRDMLYLFTEKGRAASVPVHAIPLRSSPGGGVPFSTLCALEAPSRVIAGAVVSSPEEPGAEDPQSILLLTRKGMVKKTPVSELPGSSSQVLQAMKVAPEDSVGWAFVTSGKDDILMITSVGMSIRFREADVRPMGWGTVGVMGMRLTRPEEQVAVAAVPQPREEIVLLAANGQGKRIPAAQYPVQGRYGMGTSTWKIAGKSRILGGFSGTSNDRLFLVFKDGQSKALLLDEVPRRTRQGAGKNILPRKEKGVLDSLVPVRIKEPAAKKRKAVAKPHKAPAHSVKRTTKKKRGKK